MTCKRHYSWVVVTVIVNTGSPHFFFAFLVICLYGFNSLGHFSITWFDFFMWTEASPPLNQTTGRLCYQVSNFLATEMDFRPRAARISRKEKIRSLKTRQIMNILHNIIKAIEERQLKFFEYLKRMRSNGISKIIWSWIPKAVERGSLRNLGWMEYEARSAKP